MIYLVVVGFKCGKVWVFKVFCLDEYCKFFYNGLVKERNKEYWFWVLFLNFWEIIEKIVFCRMYF